MSVGLIVIRAIYFAAALQLFGLLNFDLWFETTRRRRWPLLLTALVLVAAAGWLALEAAMISGEGVSLDAVGTVLRETRFGQLWIARALLSIVVAAILPWRVVAAIAAAAALVLIAATGHAGAEGSVIQLSADAIHLLAVGAWLGGLVPFALAIVRPRAHAYADAMRFSLLGAVCVGLILATGSVNAWFLVGNLPALFGTAYGRLLLLKIALFAAMVAVAAINRYRLTPLIRDDDAGALPALRRNALIEAALGITVVFIVALLGTMAPAYDIAAGRM
jgi:putative copper resistance protein D